MPNIAERLELARASGPGLLQSSPATPPAPRPRPVLIGQPDSLTSRLDRARQSVQPSAQLGPLGTETVGQTTEGRPIIQNPDGTRSSERSITIEDPRINGGRPTNIPSIFGGREVDQAEAIRIVAEAGGQDPETGRVLEGFDSIDAAVAAARERSNNIPSGEPAGDLTSRLERAQQSIVAPVVAQPLGLPPIRRGRPVAPAGQPPPPGIPDLTDLNAQGRLSSAGGALVQGGADIIGSIPQSVAVAQARNNAQVLSLFDRIDAGETVLPGDAPSLEAATAIALYRSRPQDRAQLRQRFAITDPRESGFFRAGEAVQEATREAFPSNPAFEEEFGQQLARGIGSTAGFAVAGLATRGAGLSPLIGAGLTGAAAQSVSQFRDAINQGAPIGDAFEAAELGAVTGTSEAIPIARLLDRLDITTGGGFKRVLIESSKGATEEGLQELFQQTAGNLIASGLVKYDPERQVFEGVGEATGVGFTVGALFSALATMLGLRINRPAPQLGAETPSEPATGPLDEVPATGAAPEPPTAPDGPPTARPGAGRQEPTVAPPGPLSQAGPAPVGGPAVAPAVAQPGAAGATPASTDVSVVVTPRGRRIEVRPEVIDAADLVTSHDQDLARNTEFPADLQPRARERAASQAQVADIASNLQPELLGLTGSATDGAPIVGPDGVVESGNARTLAIQRAYQQGNGEAYRQFIESQGFDTTGIDQPVLVRRRTSELSDEERQSFTREANEATTLTLAASEQAVADAQTLPTGLVSEYRGGDLNSAANRQFVRQFVDAVVPVSERGAAFATDGSLSQQGLARIENALFAAAYGDAALLGALRENADTNIKSIATALLNAAPRWAQLRSQVQAGTIPANLDITDALLQAARLVSSARRTGQPVQDIVSQADLFGGGADETTQAVLGLLFRDANFTRPRSAQKVGQALDFYAAQALEANASPGLIDLPQLQPAEILRLATEGGQAVLPVAAELPETAASRAPGQPGLPGLTERLERARAASQPSGGGTTAATEDGNLSERLARARRAQERGELPDTAASFTAGVNHVGMVADQIEGVVPDQPIRREDILRPLVTALGVPLFQGRIRSKKMAGFYRRKIQEVRIKKMADVEVAAHEFAHLMDDLNPEIRQQWNPATKANARIRQELRGVSYDASKIFEGFAEFVRLWATQADKAKERAPNFYDWFEGFLDRNEHGQAWRDAQEGMHAWFAQDALSRARSKVGKAKEINAGLTPMWGKFRQGVFDDLHGINRMERELTGDINPVGAYVTARLTRARHSFIEGTLLYGAPEIREDGAHAFVGKSLTDVLAPVQDRLDDFLMYAVGRSAGELKAQGRENLFTGSEIQAMRALETAEFRQAFEDYQVWNNAILDFAQAKGVINPAKRRSWKRTQYLPFHRVGQPGSFSSTPGDWKGVKALTGGTDNLRDILGNMIGNAAMLIDAALTNEARLKVAALARQEGGARFMAKIPKESRRVAVLTDSVRQAVKDEVAKTFDGAVAVPPEFLDQVADQLFDQLPGALRALSTAQAPLGHNVVAVLRRGRPEYYEVADPLLYRSLTRLQRPARHWLWNVVTMPKRLSQLSITLSVDFLAANIARDTLMGWVMSNHGFKPMIDSARGMVSRIASDENYRDFIANGGGFSSYLVDENAFRANLDHFYASKGIDPRTVINTGRKWILAMERVTDAFEMSTRLGEFYRARAAGEDTRQAAFSAREVSTDFAMRGDWAAVEAAYDSIIFLKAAMNGLDRLYRGLAEDKNKGVIAGKTAMIAMASMGLYMLNRGNPLYDDLEDWDKDTHWHLYVPTPETIEAMRRNAPLPLLEERYIHLRYPRIWEIGGIASIAERTLENFLDDQPEETVEDAWRILRDVFRFEYIPQIIEPPVELFANRDRFRDRPIENQSMQQLQAWARAGPGTSRTLRSFGENVTRNFPEGTPEFLTSPAQIEALLRGYFNTWTHYGLMISDAVLFDDMPNLRTDQYPVLRRFFQQTPPRGSKYVAEFYDALEAATEARRTMRAMDRTFRPEIAGEIENDAANLAFNQLSRANKTMRAIAADSRFVVDVPNLPDLREYARSRSRDFPREIDRLRLSPAWNDTGALKRELLDLLTRERSDLAKRVIQEIEGD